VEIAAPRLPAAGEPPGLAEASLAETTAEIEHDDFDGDTLNPVYQWLRTPWPERFLSLTERPGHLRLYGMESPGSLYTQVPADRSSRQNRRGTIHRHFRWPLRQ